MKADVEPSKTRNTADRFEHFRTRLQSRLDRHSGDLDRQNPTSEVTRVPLQRRFGNAIVARRSNSGQLEYGCFDDASQGAGFIAKRGSSEAPE